MDVPESSQLFTFSAMVLPNAVCWAALFWMTVVVVLNAAAVQPSGRGQHSIVCRQRQVFARPFDLNVDDDWPQLHAMVVNLTMTNSAMRRFQFGSALTAFSCVDLSNNALSEWPAFNCVSSLRQLNLSHNALHSWSQSAAAYRSLQALDLSFNPIATVSVDALLRMPALRVLSLAHTPIAYFGGLHLAPSLKHLVLSPDRWYAINNLDFGHRPIFTLIHDSAEARAALAIACDGRQQQQQHCVEQRMDEVSVVHPPDTCIACYVCADRPEHSHQQQPVVSDGGVLGGHGLVWLFAASAALNLLLFSIQCGLCLRLRSHRYCPNENSEHLLSTAESNNYSQFERPKKLTNTPVMLSP